MSRSGRIVRGHAPSELLQPSQSGGLAAPKQVEVPAPPQPAEPEQAEALEEVVGELLDQATAEHPPATSPETIESLDAELAALAEELIAGEPTDEPAAATPADTPELQPTPQEPAPPAAASPSPASDQPPEEPLELPPLEPDTPEESEPAAGQPTHEAAADQPPAIEAEPAPPPPSALVEAPEEPEPKPPTPALADRLITLFAAPIAGKPERRAIVAWAAAVTAFNAVCAWGYLLFIRDARPAEAPAGSVHIEPPADRAPAHGEPDDEH